jgi:hypothetical protein
LVKTIDLRCQYVIIKLSNEGGGTMKQYIAPYGKFVAVYAEDDERLHEMNPMDIIDGIFQRDLSALGLQNGHEMGFFYGFNNKKYVVFEDWTAKAMEDL